MTRHIWTGAIQLPDGTLAEVLVNVYEEGGAHTLDVALRADTWATWGLPAALKYEGVDA